MNKLIIVSLTLMSCGTKLIKKSDIAIQKKDTLYVLNKEVGPTIVEMWKCKKWVMVSKKGDTLSAKLVDSTTFTKMMKRVTPVKK